MTTANNTLLPQHAAIIAASAISGDVAQARGYRSVTDAGHLESLGFAAYQCRVPGLLIPVYDVYGAIAMYQLRPDDPRTKQRDGKPDKPLKYETPAGARMVIDCPPRVRPQLADPSVPLLVTEGVRKADAAASIGLLCIDLLGVWNWRGTTEAGGKTVLPDWHAVALEGRAVYVAYDSDAASNVNVAEATIALAEWLRSRGAHVAWIQLPDGPDGAKWGLDDYIAGTTPTPTAADILALATTELPRGRLTADQAEEIVAEVVAAGIRNNFARTDDHDVVLALDLLQRERPGVFDGFLAEYGRAGGSKKSVRDRIRSLRKKTRKRDRAKTAATEATSDTDDAVQAPRRPTFVLPAQQLDTLRQAWGELVPVYDRFRLYRQGGRLVVVEVSQRACTARLRACGKDRMAAILGRLGDWHKERLTKDGKQITPIYPPKEIVADMVECPHADIPDIESIGARPLISPAGEVCATSGYHPELRRWVQLTEDLEGIEIPTRPTYSEDVAWAKTELLTLVEDFPFVADSDRAHAIAAIIQSFVRPAFTGPTPLYLYQAPTHRTGKSLLASVTCRIAMGRASAPIASPKDEQELEKRIGGILLRGEDVVFLDNVTGKIAGGSLAAMTTAETNSVRRLGSSTIVEIPNTALWLVTANNAQVSTEIGARCLWIRLDAGVERPELRTGFRISRILEHVGRERARYIRAILILCRAWFAARCPAPSCDPIGGFEAACHTLGGILEYAGIEGFLSAAGRREFLDVADEDRMEWEEFVAEWAAHHGDARIRADTLGALAERENLLGGIIGDAKSSAQRAYFLGAALSSIRGQSFGGWRVVRDSVSRGRRSWHLERVEGS